MEISMIKVVIIGGGFAGVDCAMNLSKNGQFDLILIDKKDYFEITYAQFAALIEPEHVGKKSRFPYTSFLKTMFIQNTVKSVFKDRVIFENNDFIDYDILVIAAGSSYNSFPIGKPTEQLSLNERNSFFASENAKLSRADRIVIIGGGP
ncbi:MAG: FAD-binding protein, partial [Spirochaetaceae bacterium]